VPVLWRTSGPDRARLPPRQRVQALSALPGPSTPDEVAHVLDVLTFGEIELEGRLVDASNVALRGYLELGDIRTRVIYKPIKGERPLWDFPEGTLAEREAAVEALLRLRRGEEPDPEQLFPEPELASSTPPVRPRLKSYFNE
jgi:hypothetical protein